MLSPTIKPSHHLRVSGYPVCMADPPHWSGCWWDVEMQLVLSYWWSYYIHITYKMVATHYLWCTMISYLLLLIACLLACLLLTMQPWWLMHACACICGVICGEWRESIWQSGSGFWWSAEWSGKKMVSNRVVLKPLVFHRVVIPTRLQLLCHYGVFAIKGQKLEGFVFHFPPLCISLLCCSGTRYLPDDRILPDGTGLGLG